MKKLGFILGIVVIVMCLLYIGYGFGFHHRVLTEMYSIPTIDKTLTDAARNAHLIEQIDSGRVADARQSLELHLDTDIITIDALLNSSDGRSRDLAQKILSQVASYRVAHPNPRSDQWVRAILDRAKQPPPK